MQADSLPRLTVRALPPIGRSGGCDLCASLLQMTRALAVLGVACVAIVAIHAVRSQAAQADTPSQRLEAAALHG